MWIQWEKHNLNVKAKCIISGSAIARLHRFIEFRKHFDLPYEFYGYVKEGAARPLIAKWHKEGDNASYVNVKGEKMTVKQAVEKLRKQLESGYQKVCKVELDKMKETASALEHLEKTKLGLTKKQRKQLTNTKTALKRAEKGLPAKDVEKLMTDQTRTLIYKELRPKSQPIGLEKRRLVLEFSGEDYGWLESHFSEGKKALNPKALADKIEAYLQHTIIEKVAMKGD